MPIFTRTSEEKIVIHERMMLFDIRFARKNDSTYTARLEIPLRDPDGTYIGIDMSRGIEFDRGATATIPFDGSEMNLPRGEVKVSILSDDGISMEIEVNPPKGWIAVPEEIFERDDYKPSRDES